MRGAKTVKRGNGAAKANPKQLIESSLLVQFNLAESSAAGK